MTDSLSDKVINTFELNEKQDFEAVKILVRENLKNVFDLKWINEEE